MSSEEKICRQINNTYLDLIANNVINYSDLFINHIANEGTGSKNPHINRIMAFRGKRCRDMGTQAGFPDYIVCWRNGGVGFQEVKTIKGKLTKNQKEILDILDEQGFNIAVPRSCNEFFDNIKDWSGLNI